MEKRVISTQMQDEDIKIEKTLRPMTLDEYIGQEKAKANLKVYIEAAKQRGESLDHVLILWPLRDLVRLLLPALLPMKWAYI